MSDRERTLDFLRERGGIGVTSFELRRFGITGNPSQRIRELRDEGYVISQVPYAEAHRQGRRYFLELDLHPGSSTSGAGADDRETAGASSDGPGVPVDTSDFDDFASPVDAEIAPPTGSGSAREDSSGSSRLFDLPREHDRAA